MNLNLKATLIGAAVAGLIGASATSFSVAVAAAGDDVKGKCIGANSCQGKANCAQAGKNECAGKNGCEGKGFLETTKAECDAMMMKGKKVKFEPVQMDEKKAGQKA